jgi:hypothetical protein
MKDSLGSYCSHPETVAGTAIGPVKGRIKGLAAVYTTSKDLVGDDAQLLG